MTSNPFRRGESAEAVALETDVVRFVAVVGLTLMVIFALVHSLPYRSEPASEVDPSRAPGQGLVLVPKEDLEEMSRQEALRRAEELQLSQEIAARNEAEAELERTRQRANDLGGELDRTTRRADELKGRLREAVLGAKQAEQRIEQLKIDSLIQDEEKAAEIARLEGRVLELETELEPDSSTTTAATDIVAPTPDPQPAPITTDRIPPPPPTETYPRPDEMDTLVLRFRNDDVYLDLLRRRRIRSYLRVPGLELTYQISNDHKDKLGFSLIYGLDPQTFYRIPDAMVPAVLRRATQRFDVKLATRSDTEYLVVLSDNIEREVYRLQSGGRVGHYDILDDESVVPVGRE